MWKFLNSLSILSILFSTIYMHSIYGDWYQDPYATEESIEATIGDGLSFGLDFSEYLPNLVQLALFPHSWNWSDIYLAKDDAGLHKNVNLKKLEVAGMHPQIPISLSYLPSVEHYKVFSYSSEGDVAVRNLNYLSRVLPSLKTLELYFERLSSSIRRETFPMLFENISKLELLEDLYIDTRVQEWGISYIYYIYDTERDLYIVPVLGILTFTDQEIEVLSKMSSLKNLCINILSTSKKVKMQFDPEKLQLLRELLPNTNIEINVGTYDEIDVYQ